MIAVPTVQRLDLMDDVNINTEELMWAKRFASRTNFGFVDSDEEDDDWQSPDETYVVSEYFLVSHPP